MSTGRQIQIGGPDVLSYGEMLDRMAVVTDPTGMALFGIEPIGFDQALRRAVSEDPELTAA